jgi:hypothetical protein
VAVIEFEALDLLDLTFDQWAAGGSSSAVFFVPPTPDPVSPAFNNWRFDCAVTSDNGGFDTGHISFGTSLLFLFTVPRRCRIQVHAHFLPLGTATCRGNRPVTLLDGPGFGRFTIWTGAHFGVHTPGFASRRFETGFVTAMITNNVRRGTNSVTRKRTFETSPEILDHFVTLDSSSIASPGDLLLVEAGYRVECISVGGGAVRADFSGNGLGLNVPMAVAHFLDP